MACSLGYIQLAASAPKVHTCTTTSGTTVNVTLEKYGTETYPFNGVVRLILYREASNADAWIKADSKDIGAWNSNGANKNSSFTGLTKGLTYRIVPEFYIASNYTNKAGGDASHIFYQG
ncbi:MULTISPECIES: hypothetical protein [Lysinibacillus]|uniref:hypothetical protein n=1 Tax=Lysinibacillus TaxID=400634 RepID=UPI000561DA43|nr:hypothetical protein [Lysinibacillus sphaericus]